MSWPQSGFTQLTLSAEQDSVGHTGERAGAARAGANPKLGP